MSPGEQEEMFMFVDSRKDKAQGQGEVKSYKKKSKKVCCLVDLIKQLVIRYRYYG